jgi:hypothetical protein
VSRLGEQAGWAVHDERLVVLACSVVLGCASDQLAGMPVLENAL